MRELFLDDEFLGKLFINNVYTFRGLNFFSVVADDDEYAYLVYSTYDCNVFTEYAVVRIGWGSLELLECNKIDTRSALSNHGDEVYYYMLKIFSNGTYKIKKHKYSEIQENIKLPDHGVFINGGFY